MQGLAELAQAIFQNRVRIAIPDYIGVREPQYATAVGMIKYFYKNARLQGRFLDTVALPVEQKEKRTVKQQSAKGKNSNLQEENLASKMKRFLGSFFE